MTTKRHSVHESRWPEEHSMHENPAPLSLVRSVQHTYHLRVSAGSPARRTVDMTQPGPRCNSRRESPESRCGKQHGHHHAAIQLKAWRPLQPAGFPQKRQGPPPHTSTPSRQPIRARKSELDNVVSSVYEGVGPNTVAAPSTAKA